jgi:hypothetical protein
MYFPEKEMATELVHRLTNTKKNLKSTRYSSVHVLIVNYTLQQLESTYCERHDKWNNIYKNNLQKNFYDIRSAHLVNNLTN